MRRKKYSVNIADYIGGTRSLSDRAYRVYHEVCLLIAEAGGRLAMKTEKDEQDARARLNCDRRKWFAAMAELRAGDRPKLRLVDGWLVNKRCLVECDVLLVAMEQWGWARATLIDTIGVDARDIEAAYRRREQVGGAVHKPVDSVASPPAVTRPRRAAEACSAEDRPEVSPTSGGSLAERHLDIVTYQGLGGIDRFPLLSSIYEEEEIETPSPVPRARDPGGGRLLGVKPAGTPREHGFRWGRPESAAWKLFAALINDGIEADRALALIDRAANVDDPDHLASARECEFVSHRHRCGWYRPRRVVN